MGRPSESIHQHIDLKARSVSRSMTQLKGNERHSLDNVGGKVQLVQILVFEVEVPGIMAAMLKDKSVHSHQR
ncbi:hypothetical protein BX666DRAFT_1964256 [Dichotomocladium elegans]|nr:hypothetical protein BX666DRAFT_1964256 [Dichotomocladium elegans]